MRKCDAATTVTSTAAGSLCFRYVTVQMHKRDSYMTRKGPKQPPERVLRGTPSKSLSVVYQSVNAALFSEDDLMRHFWTLNPNVVS